MAAPRPAQNKAQSSGSTSDAEAAQVATVYPKAGLRSKLPVGERALRSELKAQAPFGQQRPDLLTSEVKFMAAATLVILPESNISSRDQTQNATPFALPATINAVGAVLVK